MSAVETTLVTDTGATVQMYADGTFLYSPYEDFFGADSFTYIVTDGELTDTAAVSVDVQLPADAILGDDSRDQLRGDAGDNVIYGFGNKDHLWGKGGDDILSGGEGNDHLYGGTGADKLYGGEDDDRLWGGKGDDLLYGGAGDDILWGGHGDDVLHGGAGSDKLHGGHGSDQFVFDSFDTAYDTIYGFETGEGGDVLNIADILKGFDPVADAIEDFVQITENKGNVEIQIKAEGDFTTVAIIEDGIGDLSVLDLVNAGNLVVEQDTAATL